MVRPRVSLVSVTFLVASALLVAVVVKSAPLLDERPYYDDPYYPTDLDGANSSKYSELNIGRKWTKPVLTYSVLNYTANGTIRATFRRAFDSWSRLTNLDFVELAPGAEVDIQLSFEDWEHTLRGIKCRFTSPQTLAHAFLPDQGDIHFHTRYFFDEGTSMDQLLNTAIHEIGHSLGLIHSPSRGSIMYGAQTSQLLTEPQPEDVQAIQELYGIRTERPSSTSEAPPTTLRTTLPTTTTQRPRTSSKLCALKSYDTITTDHRGNVCVLAGQFYFNLNETNPPARKLSAKWRGLPMRVDAGFTYTDQKTYFFKGKQYWKYDKLRLEEHYPQAIAGRFPDLPSDLDAILIVKSGGFLAFKQHQYWFFDTREDKPIKPVYPKQIQQGLRGFPTKVDAALMTTTRRRFVFSGFKYYEVDDRNNVISREGDVRADWFNC